MDEKDSEPAASLEARQRAAGISLFAAFWILSLARIAGAHTHAGPVAFIRLRAEQPVVARRVLGFIRARTDAGQACIGCAIVPVAARVCVVIAGDACPAATRVIRTIVAVGAGVRIVVRVNACAVVTRIVRTRVAVVAV